MPSIGTHQSNPRRQSSAEQYLRHRGHRESSSKACKIAIENACWQGVQYTVETVRVSRVMGHATSAGKEGKSCSIGVCEEAEAEAKVGEVTEFVVTDRRGDR